MTVQGKEVPTIASESSLDNRFLRDEQPTQLTRVVWLCISLLATFLAAWTSLASFFETGGFAWAWWANAIAVIGVYVIHRAHCSLAYGLLASLHGLSIFAANSLFNVNLLDNSVMSVINAFEIALVAKLLINNLDQDSRIISPTILFKLIAVIVSTSVVAGIFFKLRYDASILSSTFNWLLSDLVAYIPMSCVLIAFLFDREPVVSARNILGLLLPTVFLLLFLSHRFDMASELLIILIPLAFVSLFTTFRTFAVSITLLTIYELTRLPVVIDMPAYEKYSNIKMLLEYVFVVTVLATIAFQRFANHVVKTDLQEKSTQLDFAMERAQISIFELDQNNGLAKMIGGHHPFFVEGKPFKMIDAIHTIMSESDASMALQALNMDNQSFTYHAQFPGEAGFRWSHMKTGKSFSLDGSIKRLAVIYDVTEEIVAQKRLEETTEKLAEQQFTIELAGQSAGIGFFKHSVMSGIVSTDATYNRIHGFPSEVTEVSIEEVFPKVYPPDLECLSQLVEDILQHPRPERTEYRVMIHGIPKWVRVIVVPRQSYEGIVLHGAIQDIDEEKSQQVNEQLLKKIRSLTESVGGHFYAVRNLSNDEISLAMGFLEYFGLDNTENLLQIRQTLEHVHPNDRDRVRQYFDEVSTQTNSLDTFSEDSVSSIGGRIRVSSGAYHWFQITLCRVNVNDVEYEVVNLYDVDELAKASLRASENAQRLSMAIDAAALGVLELNLTKDKFTANEHLSTILELDNELSSFAQFTDFCHPEDRSLFESYWQQHRDGMTSGDLQYRVSVTSGIKWLEAKVGFRTRESGEVIAYMTVSNITEMKTKQFELEKLVAELRERRIKQNHMFAIIAHELRTPLSAIKMMQDEQDIASIKPYGQAIVDATKSLLSTLDDMRSVVNPELVVTRDATVDRLDEIVKKAISPHETLLNLHGINLHLGSDSLSSHYYRFNAQALRQITSNLVKNAALHANATDIWVDLSTTQNDDKAVHVTLKVEDNGSGIDEHIATNLFDAFVRGNSDAEGTGLGLHIAKILAEKLGGEIRYEASPKGGACFIVGFELEPYSDPQSTVPSDAPSEMSVLKGLNILFVEDQKTIQLISQKMLERAGASVTVADNGKEALAKFESEAFDLILTDIMMPELDGYALTSELRARHFEGDIIGISAAVLGEEAEKMLVSGANAVIPKPFSLDALVAQLKRH